MPLWRTVCGRDGDQPSPHREPGAQARNRMPVRRDLPRGAGMAVSLLPALGLVLWALADAAPASERVALVIGNAAYAHAPALANPLNDAADAGAALGRLGFAVTRLENVGDAEMRRGLKEFTRAASASEVAVVFYAGHGIEVDGRNFLVPVDAQLASDQDVEFEAVPLELVSRAVERASGFRLVILDACRENPFAASMQRTGATRSIGRGLARVEPSGETLVAYAAKGGTVASDGAGRNSPYSEALLRHLEEPGLEVGLMFRKVRDAVLAMTGGRQEPFVYGSLSSRGVYFIPPTGTEHDAAGTIGGGTAATSTAGSASVSDRMAAEQLAAKRLTLERELLFWRSIKDSEEPADFRAYLGRYPGGEYEALARNRLERLERALQEQAPREVSVSVAAIAPTLESQELMRPPAPAVSSPETMESSLGLERLERRRIQQGLASLGFDPGPADGLFGRSTRGAIELWQASRGGEATGYLDAESAKVLLAALAEAEANARAAGAERLAAERGFWAAVKGSENPGDFKAYLESYPEGEFEALARRRLAELIAQADDAAYAHAKSMGTAAAYKEYMSTYPSGRHLGNARLLRAEAEELERLVRRWPIGKKFRDCNICPELVVLPAPDKERLNRTTDGKLIAVGVYEVTRAEFEQFYKDETTRYRGGSCSSYDRTTHGWKKRSRRWTWQNPGFPQTGRHPVVCMNYADAQAYLRWLTRKTGESYRLLTVSEWEYAARARTTTPYHTGSAISVEEANFGRTGRYKERTAPVGSYPPNAFGLHDVHGNVWERVEHCPNSGDASVQNYDSMRLTGKCSGKGLRGGSYWDPPNNVGSTSLWKPDARGASPVIGFRVARTLE